MHFEPFKVNEVFAPFKAEIEAILGGEIKIDCEERTAPNGTFPYEHFTTSFSICNVSNKQVSFFSLSGLAGCCGVCVSHGSFVTIKKKGIGTILNRFRMALAKDAEFGLMICTDWASNEAQNKIMKKNGWKLATEFHNPKSGHKLNLHYVDLN